MKFARRWLIAAAAWLRGDACRLLLLAAVIVLAILLGEGEKPWEGRGAERLVEGERLGVEHYVALASWWAALANFLLLTVLLVTRPWWKKRAQQAGGSAGWPERHWQRRAIPGWSVAVLLVALLFAAGYRGRLLNREILRDEQDNLRRNIFGYHDRQADGSLQFVDVPWRDTFFENRLANNPVLFSALSHASLSVWQKFSGAGNERFSLVAVRLPAFLAGLASLAAVWWALNVFGFIRAAPVAALLLALHPYHADYTLQARGYSLVLLLVTTAAACLLRALNSGRWRWWWGFALSLFGMLYAYAGAIYALIALGAVALSAVLALFRNKQRRAAGIAQLCRLTVVAIVAGGCYLQLMAPSLPQVGIHLSQDFEKIPLSATWYSLAFQKYFAGVRFLQEQVADADEKSQSGYLAEHVIPVNPGLATLMLLVLPALTIFGLVRALRRDRLGGVMLATGVGAPLLSWAHATFITKLYLYDWYWIYALPFLFMLIAIGATAWWSREDAAEVRAAAVFGAERRVSARRVASILSVLLLVGWFWWQTKPGKYGRPLMTLDVKGPTAVFARGDYDWVVYRDGRMIRESKEP